MWGGEGGREGRSGGRLQWGNTGVAPETAEVHVCLTYPPLPLLPLLTTTCVELTGWKRINTAGPPAPAPSPLCPLPPHPHLT